MSKERETPKAKKKKLAVPTAAALKRWLAKLAGAPAEATALYRRALALEVARRVLRAATLNRFFQHERREHQKPEKGETDFDKQDQEKKGELLSIAAYYLAARGLRDRRVPATLWRSTLRWAQETPEGREAQREIAGLTESDAEQDDAQALQAFLLGLVAQPTLDCNGPPRAGFSTREELALFAAADPDAAAYLNSLTDQQRLFFDALLAQECRRRCASARFRAIFKALMATPEGTFPAAGGDDGHADLAYFLQGMGVEPSALAAALTKPGSPSFKRAVAFFNGLLAQDGAARNFEGTRALLAGLQFARPLWL